MADSQALRNMRYREQIENARRRYEHGQDDVYRYFGKSGLVALQTAADAYIAEYPHHGAKVRNALTLSQPALQAALEALAHRLRDPHHAASHETILEEIIRHARDKFSDDLQPIRSFLVHLGIKI